MQKNDPTLIGLGCSIYFGIVGGLLAWATDAGIIWEVFAGLAGALLGGVYGFVLPARFGDRISRRDEAYRRMIRELDEPLGLRGEVAKEMASQRGYRRLRLYLWIGWCAVLGTALPVVLAPGAAKMKYGLLGSVTGALVGLVLGGIDYFIGHSVTALRLLLVETLGPIGGHAVTGGLGVGCLVWVLWSRWSHGDGHAIIGGVIAGLVFAILIAAIEYSSAGRSPKKESSKSLE